MAFFLPRTIYHTQASSPLYRLLSDVDRVSRRNRDVCYVYRTVAPRPWQPRFDAQETANVYLIRGELPGLTKENVTVDFPEPQKMVIRGKVVETSNDEASQQPAAQTTQPEPQVPAVESPAPASPISESGRSRNSYQATVEDDDENEDFDVVSDFSEKEEEKPQQQSAPAPQQEVTKPQPSAEVTQAQAPEQTQPKPTQRVVREFSRTFTFPGPIDYDGTTADLKDGLLTIVVPKPKKPEPRRIIIN